MANYPADELLLNTVKALVEANANNQSAAARLIKTSRLRVHRLLSQDGRVTERVRRDLWAGVRALQGGRHAETDDREPGVVIQNAVSIPELAKQVIQLIAEAVEVSYPMGGDDAVRH